MTDTTLDDLGEIETDAEGRQICPICGFHAKNLGAHMRRHQANEDGAPAASSNGNGRRRTGMRIDTDKPPAVNFREEEDKLVESLTTVGMFVAPLVPHTGLTIISRAGDREIPIPNAKPVRKRGMASVIMDYAKQDPRVMRGVVRFNNLMHGGDAFELAASLAAAVAVDVHVVSPHLQLPIPGVPEEAQPQPIMMLIGDVVQDIEQRVAAAQGEYEPQAETVEAGAEA